MPSLTSLEEARAAVQLLVDAIEQALSGQNAMLGIAALGMVTSRILASLNDTRLTENTITTLRAAIAKGIEDGVSCTEYVGVDADGNPETSH